MAVAPSFKEMRIVKDVYIKNGRNYVDVLNEKTGTIRSVRWYTDLEYAKQYGKDEDSVTFLNLKRVRGFSKGPILVVRGNTEQDDNWLRQSLARYAVGIGWYFVSEDIFINTITFPENAPKNFRYLLLQWEEFISSDNKHMKTPEELERIILEKDRNEEWIK